MTNKHGSVTSRRTGTGFQPRQNGNMHVVPGQIRNTASAITPVNWGRTPGIPVTHKKRRTPLGKRNPIHGDFTICTGTFPNGAMTGTPRTITKKAPNEIRRDRRPARRECCVAERGIPAPKAADPHIAQAILPWMIHVYQKIPSVFGV